MTMIRRAILALALIAGLAPAMAQVPAPVPALPDTERRTSYSISGTTCACAVNFALYGDSTDYQNWVEVFLNGTRVNFNDATFGWTITSPSGPIANLARPISNAVLTFNSAQTGTVQIVGARRPRRTTQVSQGAGVAARDFNLAITDLVAQNRELWDKTNDVTGRAVLAPPGETLALLPIAATRSNQGACFSSTGNLTSCVSVPTSSFIAGNGITLSGVGPTTIAANLLAGTGISITGTSPLTIATNLAAGAGISLTGSNPTTIASTVLGTVTSVTCGTGLSGGAITTSGTCALALTNATLQATFGSPTGTTNAAGLMMGLGTTCKLTPVYGTRILAHIEGSLQNSTTSVSADVAFRFGTGTAPTNLAALTGTEVGSTLRGAAAPGGFLTPATLSVILTGLTPGTAYWFDVRLAAPGGGTASIVNVSCNAMEF